MGIFRTAAIVTSLLFLPSAFPQLHAASSMLPGTTQRIYVKSSPLGKSLFDVYVRTSPTAEAIKFSSIRDVSSHYHCAEYHGGNLYVIVRPGGDPGDNPNWTDELWRYDRNGNAKKLYSHKGLDFRVKPDESLIAIAVDSDNNSSGPDSLVFLRRDGSTAKTLRMRGSLSRFGAVDFEGWTKDSLWIKDQEAMDINAFIEVRIPTWQAKRYDSLQLCAEDYSFNMQARRLAYSDFPVTFDSFDHELLRKKRTPVSFYVYDLVTKKKTLVSKSVFKEFKPSWVGTNTVEFDNPKGSGRLRKTVK